MPDPPPRQLPLALEHPPKLGVEDYLIGPFNETAQALVRAWPAWPAPCLLLVGPEGAGKSHLARVFAAESSAVLLAGAHLREETVAGVQPGGVLVLEGTEDADEVLLFHLVNTVRERAGWLLLTARQGPTPVWPSLPDLASRLRAMPRAEIHPPDEAVLRTVLVKLLDDRQLRVEAGVLDYLARHLDRSIAAARTVVAELDGEALARGRKPGRKLAAEVLARIGAVEPD